MADGGQYKELELYVCGVSGIEYLGACPVKSCMYWTANTASGCGKNVSWSTLVQERGIGEEGVVAGVRNVVLMLALYQYHEYLMTLKRRTPVGVSMELEDAVELRAIVESSAGMKALGWGTRRLLWAADKRKWDEFIGTHVKSSGFDDDPDETLRVDRLRLRDVLGVDKGNYLLVKSMRRKYPCLK